MGHHSGIVGHHSRGITQAPGIPFRLLNRKCPGTHQCHLILRFLLILFIVDNKLINFQGLLTQFNNQLNFFSAGKQNVLYDPGLVSNITNFQRLPANGHLLQNKFTIRIGRRSQDGIGVLNDNIGADQLIPCCFINDLSTDGLGH